MDNFREADQDLTCRIQRAAQVQATFEQIERQLSHRYESEELCSTRARLKRIREYIRLATLECSGAAAVRLIERLFLQWVYGTTFAAIAGGIWHAWRPIGWWTKGYTLAPAALLFVSGAGVVWALADFVIQQRHNKQGKLRPLWGR